MLEDLAAAAGYVGTPKEPLAFHIAKQAMDRREASEVSVSIWQPWQHLLLHGDAARCLFASAGSGQGYVRVRLGAVRIVLSCIVNYTTA